MAKQKRKYKQQEITEFFNIVKKELKKNDTKIVPDGDWAYNCINMNQNWYFKKLLKGDVDSCDEVLAKIVINAFYLFVIHREYLGKK